MSIEKAGSERHENEVAPDTLWIQESFSTFSEFASESYHESGRGVIALGLQHTDVEETNVHFYPMLYVPTDEIKDWGWKNQEVIIQMVHEYTPVQEFILVLMQHDWEHVMRASFVTRPQSQQRQRMNRRTRAQDGFT